MYYSQTIPLHEAVNLLVSLL